MRPIWITAVLAGVAPLLMAASPSSGVPNLDVKGTCHARGTAEQIAKDSCMQDELGAKKELDKMWGRVPANVRRTCLDEVHIGGSPSYVELLTCSQMNEWSKQTPNTQAPNAATGPVPASRPAPVSR